jgi:hypothetical protein
MRPLGIVEEGEQVRGRRSPGVILPQTTSRVLGLIDPQLAVDSRSADRLMTAKSRITRQYD